MFGVVDSNVCSVTNHCKVKFAISKIIWHVNMTDRPVGNTWPTVDLVVLTMKRRKPNPRENFEFV